MTQKRIPNAAFVVAWTTVVGALEGALRAAGEPHPTHELMGITGHAFRLALTEADGVLAAPPAAAALDLIRALPLYRNAGRRLELIHVARDERDFPKHREKAIKAIHKSINRGRPVIAYDLHLPEFGLITGYDDRAHTLAVSSLTSAHHGQQLPEGRWPVPEHNEPLIVLLLGDRERIDPTRPRRDALRFALDYAHHGDPNDPTGATHGLAAFTRWRDAFERGAPIDPTGNAHSLQTVQAARHDAARFLRDTAATTPPAATAPILEAAAAYDRIALTLSRMATLFPYPVGGDVTGQAGRIVAVSALREAETHERRAVELLAQALEEL